MTTPAHRHSAIVYDFAAKARAIAASRGRTGAGSEQAMPALPKMAFGSGSYHDAAIQEEADRTRKQ